MAGFNGRSPVKAASLSTAKCYLQDAHLDIYGSRFSRLFMLRYESYGINEVI